MLALFEGPLYVTDDYIQAIYTEIYNILILAHSPSDVNRLLLRLCTRKGHQSPHNYFKWGFDGKRFWLKQRLAYRSEECFAFRLLTILRYTSPDRSFVSN